MLPKELVARFWIAVRRLLETEHGLSAEQALHGIADYRRALGEADAHQWAYHDGEAYVARTIAGLSRPPHDASGVDRARRKEA